LAASLEALTADTDKLDETLEADLEAEAA